MKTYSTTCPRNCYTTCYFNVVIENNEILRIEPNPANRTTAQGTCLKGLTYLERTKHPDRILFPLKKNILSNEFEKISWTEVFNILTEKLTYIKEKYGNKSILFYAASGMAGLLNRVSTNFWKLFGGCTTTYGSLCWSAGLEAVRLTLGENKHNAPWETENSQLIVLWGKNPAETNVQEMVYIEKAQAKGAKLIVIDPRRTNSAERANLLIQQKPGTDAMLALAVAKLLIENQQVDENFIEKNVLGFEKFAESLKKFSIETAAKITEVPQEFIYQFANFISDLKPATFIVGYGMQRFSNGGQTVRSILTLPILTGNIGKKGAGFQYANLQSEIFSTKKEPLTYFPTENAENIFRKEISTAKLGENILNITNPELKMIWCERGNPISQNPDTNTILKAFRSLDFRVCVEEFLTDTAKECDIILPAKNLFEQSDIQCGYWHSYIQWRQKIFEPAGEVKPETEIYYLLAKNLGYSDEIIEKAGIPKPTDNDIEHFLEKILTSVSNISLNELKNSPQLSPFFEEIAFSDLKFNTPSGKIEIFSQQAEHFWNVSPLPTYENLQELPENSKYSLYLLTPNTKNRIHSQFNNLESIKILSNEATIYINSQDALQRNIKNNDKVLVFNDRGEIKLTAKINFSLKKGCVAITNGWQGSENPNFLSCGRETDMGFGTAFHDNLVEVKKN